MSEKEEKNVPLQTMINAFFTIRISELDNKSLNETTNQFIDAHFLTQYDFFNNLIINSKKKIVLLKEEKKQFRDINRLINKNLKASAKNENKLKTKKGNSEFMKERIASDSLCDFMGIKHKSLVNLPSVIKFVSNYANKNNLKDKDNKSFVTLDNNLKTAFSVDLDTDMVVKFPTKFVSLIYTQLE